MARRPAKRRLREARAELYRTLVRDAAERVFAEHGFAGARVETIAAEAGLSVGTIYRVFPGKKRAIYQAIQEQRGTEVIGTARALGTAVWAERGDLLEAILAGLAAVAEYFLARPDYLRVVLREERAWTVDPQRSTGQTTMWQQGMADAVEAMRLGIAAGLFVEDDPARMARTSAAMQQAHLAYWLEQRRRAARAEVVGGLQRQFLRAFCRPAVLAARALGDGCPPSPAENVPGAGGPDQETLR